MNKKEIIDYVAENTGFLKKDVSLVIEETFGAITTAMCDGDKVTIAGFGSFKTKERKARIARNLQTGETINVPAKNAPTFKASKQLKEAVL